MPSIPPLWDGYEDRSEQDLLAMLERKVEAATDENDPTVDEDVARHLAQAIASHESLKQAQGAPDHHAGLYARARAISTDDVGSWRPK